MEADAAHPQLRLYVDGAFAELEHRRICRSGSVATRWCLPPAAVGDADRRGLPANGIEDFDQIRFWTTPVSKCTQANACRMPLGVDYIGVIGGR